MNSSKQTNQILKMPAGNLGDNKEFVATVMSHAPTNNQRLQTK
jgi:hypothetical protein